MTLSYQLEAVWILAVAQIVCWIIYLLAKLSLAHWWRAIKLIVPFILTIGIYYTAIGQWQKIALSVLRLGLSLGFANLLSLTTPLQSILKEDGRMDRVLRRLRIPTDKLRLAIHVVLRTIPLLLEEMRELRISLRLRGCRRQTHKIVFPLLLRSVMYADKMTDAFKLRGME